MNADFARAIILKVAFKPEPLRRAQAALLYIALSGEAFTADVLPKEIVGDDPKLPGCAVGTLATMELIQSIAIVNSPSKSRHGGLVRRWRLAPDKRTTALTWLKRNGFDTTVPLETQGDLLATPTEYPR